MNILILEDNKERIAYFSNLRSEHSVTITEFAHEAIRLLKENKWDILMLDHDLGGQEMVPSGPGTGYEVADFLSKNEHLKPERIIIHSFNGPGSQNMKAALPEAEWIPGIWLKFKI